MAADEAGRCAGAEIVADHLAARPGEAADGHAEQAGDERAFAGIDRGAGIGAREIAFETRRLPDVNLRLKPGGHSGSLLVIVDWRRAQSAARAVSAFPVTP